MSCIPPVCPDAWWRQASFRSFEEAPGFTEDRQDFPEWVRSEFLEPALVESEPASRWLADANVLQDRMHIADLGAHAVTRKARMGESSRRMGESSRAREPGEGARLRTRAAKELFLQCYITLWRGWLGDDPEVILAFWEKQSPTYLQRDDRASVFGQLAAAREMVLAVRDTIAERGLDVTEMLRRLAASVISPAAFPGTTLMLAAVVHNHSDARRLRRRSDWVDVEHVTHFPYVDVATCDRNTLQAVRSALAALPCPRPSTVLRTGRLEAVVEVLETTPEG